MLNQEQNKKENPPLSTQETQDAWLPPHAPVLPRPYLVGPLVGLQQLAVERRLVLHGVQAQQAAVVERVVLGRLAHQVAQTFQLAAKSRRAA